MMKKFNFGDNLIPNVHEEGFMAIMISTVMMIISIFISKFLFLLFLLSTISCIYFFRDPKRMVPQDDNLLLSPADGLIVDIKEGIHSPISKNDDLYTRVSIFLHINNVHVNRLPCSGIVSKISYHRGKFINASFDKASDDNEKQFVEINHNGEKILVVQIAGFIARRIVCDLKEDQEVNAGHRFGIIKFGSRVDLYIPSKYNDQLKVAVGQTVIGGETIINKFDCNEEQREFLKI